jgi:hypothetical protein
MLVLDTSIPSSSISILVGCPVGETSLVMCFCWCCTFLCLSVSQRVFNVAAFQCVCSTPAEIVHATAFMYWEQRRTIIRYMFKRRKSLEQEIYFGRKPMIQTRALRTPNSDQCWNKQLTIIQRRALQGSTVSIKCPLMSIYDWIGFVGHDEHLYLYCCRTPMTSKNPKSMGVEISRLGGCGWWHVLIAKIIEPLWIHAVL